MNTRQFSVPIEGFIAMSQRAMLQPGNNRIRDLIDELEDLKGIVYFVEFCGAYGWGPSLKIATRLRDSVVGNVKIDHDILGDTETTAEDIRHADQAAQELSVTLEASRLPYVLTYLLCGQQDVRFHHGSADTRESAIDVLRFGICLGNELDHLSSFQPQIWPIRSMMN